MRSRDSNIQPSSIQPNTEWNVHQNPQFFCFKAFQTHMLISTLIVIITSSENASELFFCIFPSLFLPHSQLSTKMKILCMKYFEGHEKVIKIVLGVVWTFNFDSLLMISTFYGTFNTFCCHRIVVRGESLRGWRHCGGSWTSHHVQS